MSFRHYAALEKKLDSGDWEKKKLSPSEVNVLFALAGFADNDTSTCFPKIKTIGKRVQLAKGTVSVAVASLREKVGLIATPRVIDGENTSHLYDLSFLLKPVVGEKPSNPAKAEGGDESPPGPDCDAAGSEQSDQGGGAKAGGGGAKAALPNTKGAAPAVEISLKSVTYSPTKSPSDDDVDTLPESFFFEKMAAGWNVVCTKPFPAASRLTHKLIRDIRRACDEQADPPNGISRIVTIQEWVRFFQWISISPFLAGAPRTLEDGRVIGDGRPPFVASFDWIFREGNIDKIRSGRYHRLTRFFPGKDLSDMPPVISVSFDEIELAKYSPIGEEEYARGGSKFRRKRR